MLSIVYFYTEYTLSVNILKIKSDLAREILNILFQTTVEIIGINRRQGCLAVFYCCYLGCICRFCQIWKRGSLSYFFDSWLHASVFHILSLTEESCIFSWNYLDMRDRHGLIDLSSTWHTTLASLFPQQAIFSSISMHFGVDGFWMLQYIAWILLKCCT